MNNGIDKDLKCLSYRLIIHYRNSSFILLSKWQDKEKTSFSSTCVLLPTICWRTMGNRLYISPLTWSFVFCCRWERNLNTNKQSVPKVSSATPEFIYIYMYIYKHKQYATSKIITQTQGCRSLHPYGYFFKHCVRLKVWAIRERVILKALSLLSDLANTLNSAAFTESWKLKMNANHVWITKLETLSIQTPLRTVQHCISASAQMQERALN